MTKPFKVGDKVTVCEEDVKRWPELAGVKTIQRIGYDGLVWFEETFLVGRDDGIEHVPPAVTIDPARTYRTRDGREVRIYATDGPEGLAVHGATRDHNGWIPRGWYSDGHFFRDEESDEDLIEVKPEREGFLNVYRDNTRGGPHLFTARAYATKEAADGAAAVDRIACLHLKFREGDGLEGGK